MGFSVRKGTVRGMHFQDAPALEAKLVRCTRGAIFDMVQTLEEDTEMYYMTSAFYKSSAVRGVRFDDPAFHIKWPLVATVVSDQDRNWPFVER